ncbi:MAG: 50S ribosomal protein L32e [Candidatus Aenigmatarchaeota archaeon]
MVNPRNKPEFKRHMYEAYKRIGESWRRPRGLHSKVRIEKKGKIRKPKIGWGAPSELRYLHPSGYKEVLVRNVKDLEKVNKEKEAIRIASTVGKKKRKEIIEAAKKMGIWVLNYG